MVERQTEKTYFKEERYNLLPILTLKSIITSSKSVLKFLSWCTL